MRQCRGLVVALAFAAGFVGTSAARQDADLRSDGKEYPKVNQVVTLENTFEITDADVTVTAADMTGKVKQTLAAVQKEKVEYLAVDKAARQVTQTRTTVLKQKVTTVTTGADGKAQPAVTTVSKLEGVEFVSDRIAAGKWTHTLTPAATADQRKELDRRAGPENDDDLFLAAKVVVGKEWTVDAAKLQRLFGGSVTKLAGKLTLKRESDAKEAGEDCWVFTTEGKVTGVARADGGDLNVVMDLTGKTWRSKKTMVDVKDVAGGTIRMSGTVTQGGRAFGLDLTGPFSITRTATLTGP